MIFRRVIPFFLSALTPLTAADFPVVPCSGRVLSEVDVKDFWIHRLETMPLPPPATLREPEKQAERRAEIARRKELMEEIRNGRHDVAARLVCLSHNVVAWTRQGDEAKAAESANEIRRLKSDLRQAEEMEHAK